MGIQETPKSIRKDLTGQVFGHLEVLGFGGYRDGPGTHVMWYAKCRVCGRKNTYFSSNLRSEASTRCSECSYNNKKLNISPERREVREKLQHRWWKIVKHEHDWYSFDQFVDTVGYPPEGHRMQKKYQHAPHGPDNWEWVPLKVRKRRTKHLKRLYSGLTRQSKEAEA